jgi:uncharacterized membrane protein
MIFATAPSPLPSIDVDVIAGMLQNALSIGSALPGILGAIFVVFIAIAISLLLISKYFADENKRRDEAYKESKRLEHEHNANLQRIAVDYAKAAGELLSEEYRKDYELYSKLLANKDYSFLAKIAKVYHNELAGFIYDESIAPRDRAARIIHTVTGR